MATLAVGGHYLAGLGIAEVTDALLGLPGEFHPVPFVGCVDKAEGMAAKAMHVPITIRHAAVAHDDGDLVQGLWQVGPEVPVVLRAAHTGARVALHGVVEVRKIQRVA
ncbi:hypothetical protein D3C76_1543060 [compost metagenome]